MPPSLPRLYGELAGWYHLLTAPHEYIEEAAIYRDAFWEAVVPAPRTMLELGCGGGCNAFHLKRDFVCTLTDVSPQMLDVSRSINPECEHALGDMRTLRLGRQFDVVLVHDAVAYMTTEEDLRRTMETAFVHCRPGGAALFAPDFVRETFRPATDSGGNDDGDRGLRYLEWCREPDPDATTYVVDYAYLLREGNDVRVVHDRHVEGLFSRFVWNSGLEAAGFRVTKVGRLAPANPEEIGEIFVAVRPARS
ncbi:MAG: class I SAM-dependent methyltransferase [Deltaproteobacteria bacterium]|nr:class I SAM-dependent methyltransferase [Deltaproteobacteria bacterium]